MRSFLPENTAFRRMSSVVERLHASRLPGRLFHTLDACLQRELHDCVAVLDLGCGLSSPLQHCRNISHSVGVVAFAPYLDASRARGIHSQYVLNTIEDVEFPEKSFDAVVLIEVLEHLPTAVGYTVLQRAERWARKKVIVTSLPMVFSRSGRWTIIRISVTSRLGTTQPCAG